MSSALSSKESETAYMYLDSSGRYEGFVPLSLSHAYGMLLNNSSLWASVGAVFSET